MHTSQSISCISPTSSCNIIAIALQGPGDEIPLSIVGRARKAGFHVIGYEDGLEGWSLRSRCRPLIAGSSKLLDSADPRFADQLETALRNIFQRERKKQDALVSLRQEMREAGIVGNSDAMLSLFRLVKKVSPFTNLPVLITGETGTGKELIARAIHRLDAIRVEGPFIAVNCGALSAGLAESEFFGHRRGAFTGADRDRQGLFRAAHGGVLFLDEIGELDLALQAKLLRVLQEGRVLGVGYEHETSIDTRIIAATNRNLKQMVQAGTFRPDLFHRLFVLKVELPPLRERRSDIQPLVQYFLRSTEKEWHTSTDFLEAITSLPLPGNVRELENLIRRVMASKEDPSPLSLSDLPEDALCAITGGSSSSEQSTDVRASEQTKDQVPSTLDPQTSLHSLLEPLCQGRTLGASLRECERLIIHTALRHTHGRQSAAAQMLGITPRSVYNKVKKYGLSGK